MTLYRCPSPGCGFDTESPAALSEHMAQKHPDDRRVRCLDCGLAYRDFPLDLTLPDEQWRMIHPDGNGVLCANCIVKRAAAIHGAVAIRATIELVEGRTCLRPPPGWHCTRQPGHEGPCAAWPVDPDHDGRPRPSRIMGILFFISGLGMVSLVYFFLRSGAWMMP